MSVRPYQKVMCLKSGSIGTARWDKTFRKMTVFRRHCIRGGKENCVSSGTDRRLRETYLPRAQAGGRPLGERRRGGGEKITIGKGRQYRTGRMFKGSGMAAQRQMEEVDAVL